MKLLLSLCIIVVIISCSRFSQNSSTLKEDELYITRKYLGDFLDFKKSSPKSFGDPSIVWIKTTRDSVFSNISVYSNKCEFIAGDKLYLRRKYALNGGFGYWFYQIENDFSINYQIKEFIDNDKILVQSWF